jgi:hypothetical protein
VAKEELENFTRVFNIYGASLCKGEISDAISREASDHVKSFTKEASTKMDGEQYGVSIKAFDTHLQFANQHD